MLDAELLSPLCEMALGLALVAFTMRWLESRCSRDSTGGEPIGSALDHLCCDQEDVAGTLLLWLGRRRRASLRGRERPRAAVGSPGRGCAERV
jgi:hypothetical protein